MRGGTWGDDGTIVWATTSGLYRVPADGGEVRLIASPDTAAGEFQYTWPEMLPGSRALLFTVVPAGAHSDRDGSIAVLDLATADGDAYNSLAMSIEQEFGRLDGLVHNAGILGQRLSIEQHDPAEWQKVLHVNLTAAFILTQATLPLLKQSEDASVVFTSSGVGRRGKAYWGAYAVSKFGTEGLMQVLASEMADTTNVRSNSVNPGPVRTYMRLQAYPAEDRSQLPDASSVVAPYLYLLGPESRGINGQAFDCQ